MEVVHGSRGTASSAANSYYTVAGKTGTGQWGAPGKKQYVAWFAGFVPAEAPKYAFAILYEGSPGEYLSGGRKAAPMAKAFFNTFYGKKMHHLHEPDLVREQLEFARASALELGIDEHGGQIQLPNITVRRRPVFSTITDPKPVVRKALPVARPKPEPAPKPKPKPIRRGLFRRR